MPADRPRERAHAWRPGIPGVGEVLHAHFVEHAYPAHTHEQWTLLLVDTGGVDYELESRSHAAEPRSLTVLPPHVSHDGRAARPEGFDKRVVYLDSRWISDDLIGAAVRDPALRDRGLTDQVSGLHRALARRGDELEAESRLALVADRIGRHLDRRRGLPRERRAPGLARSVREQLDAIELAAPTLESMASQFGVHPSELVRAFRREYGLPPHRYLTGRRIDRARSLLLDGLPAAAVAASVGFHDQSHLTRHFRNVLGVTPAAFVRRAA
jgi:AraC-like DNA-binding protein